MPNVLIFEADSNFASELKRELLARDCKVTVVDDANVGLQSAASEPPNLILLTIELPRMNGFSVCNKLKRDAKLKDVPLIIMSSDSTDETFDQHRRLRTRAEDYVHKPVTFAELLPKISALVPLVNGSAAGEPAEEAVDDSAVVIDDDVEFAEPGDSEAPGAKAKVDSEVDEFADSAFDALIEDAPAGGPSQTAAGAKAAPAPAAAEKEEEDEEDLAVEDDLDALDLEAESMPPAEKASAQPPKARPEEIKELPKPPRAPTSVPPRPRADSIDASMKEELERLAGRVKQLEGELREARNKASELQDEASRGATKDGEVQRLRRELDEAKAKVASAAKTGSGSAREFLELREQLNKKDKEILGFRDQVSARDKELLNLRDGILVVERQKADLDDRLLDLDKRIAELERALEAARADKDQAAKRADDFKRKGEKLAGEIDEIRQRAEADLATRDARIAALAAEQDAAREQAEQRMQQAVAEAVEQAKAASAAELEVALATARSQAEKDREAAVAAKQAELKKELDSKLAALHRGNEEAMNKLKAEHAHASSEAERASRERLEAREKELNEQREAREKELNEQREAREKELNEQREARERELVAEREHRVRELSEQRETREKELVLEKEARETELLAAMSAKEAELQITKGDLDATKQQLEQSQSAGVELEAKAASLESDLNATRADRDRARAAIEDREAKIIAMEASDAAAREELEQTRRQLEEQRNRAERARSKWAEDQPALERAKDALAAALAQIDQIEERKLD